MSITHVTTTITLGDDRPTVQTWPGKHPTIVLGDVKFVVLGEDQAYALIGALREAARFLGGEDADPGDLRTTTEAEADRQAELSRMSA